jgi:hypothetical protein
MREYSIKNVKVLTVLLAAGLAFSSPLIANAKKAGAGGGEHESQKGGLPALEDRVEADEALIAALQGQSNFAVVSAAGAIVRSSSIPGPVTVAAHTSAGVYEINFGKSVTACAYTATIGDTASAAPTQGQISVSGDVDADSPNDVYVQTFDKTGLTPTDSPFHLSVTCP